MPETGEACVLALVPAPSVVGHSGGCPVRRDICFGGILGVLRDSYAETQFARGLARLDQHEYREAIAFLDQAMGSDPEAGEYWFRRAHAQQKLGDFSGAVGDYAQAFRLTQDPYCLAAIGYCYARTGDREAAYASYRSAVDNGSGTAEVLTGLGYCYAKMQKYVEADKYLTQAIARNPSLARAHYIQALILSKLAKNVPGDHGSRAVTAIRKWL